MYYDSIKNEWHDEDSDRVPASKDPFDPIKKLADRIMAAQTCKIHDAIAAQNRIKHYRKKLAFNNG